MSYLEAHNAYVLGFIVYKRQRLLEYNAGIKGLSNEDPTMNTCLTLRPHCLLCVHVLNGI